MVVSIELISAPTESKTGGGGPKLQPLDSIVPAVAPHTPVSESKMLSHCKSQLSPLSLLDTKDL